MDFSAFSAPDFDPIAWLNDALAQPRPPGESLLQHVSNMRTKIQVVSMGLINSLDELSAQCVSRIPRVLRDIEQIRKEALQLRAYLQEQEGIVSQLEGDTSRSIAELARLDELKSQVTAMTRIVSEADRFKTQLKTFEETNENADVRTMARALEELNASYDVLKDLPDFKNYKINIATYRERLESQLRPKLINSFNNHSSAEAIECVEIFRQIGRLDEVLSLYYRSRIPAINKLWQDFDAPKTPLAPGQPLPPPAVPFPKWLPGFFNELLHLLNTEAPWLIGVFQDPADIVSGLLLECLKSINESYEQRLALLSLDQLIQSYSATKTFAENLRGIVASAGPTRRFQVKVAIFQPYRQMQSRYAQIEKAFISRDVSALKPTKGDFMTTISNMRDTVPKLFLLLESTVQRCNAFTAGCESETLVNSVIQVVMDEYVAHFKTLVVHLRQVAGLDAGQQSEALKKKLTATDGEVFHDWKEAFFQGALQLLEVSNNLEQRLQGFIQTLCSALLQQKSKLFASTKSTSITEFEYVDSVDPILEADHSKAKKLFAFMSSIEDASTRAILSSSEKSMQQLISTSQRFVFDTMFAYVRDKLTYVPSFDEWAKESTPGAVVLNFSLSPLGYIKLIVEHLLILPQVLEPYDSHEALERIAVDEIRAAAAPTNSSVATLVDSGEDEDSGRGRSSGYAAQWIGEVTRATQTLYLSKILEIPRLSSYGAAQLATDIGHLFNVLNVLGMPPVRALEVAQKCLKAPAASFDSVVANFSKETEIGISNRIKTLRKL